MQTVITNTEFSKTVSLLKDNYRLLSSDGCFFAIVRTEYDKQGTVTHDFFDIISIATKLGYEYINTIVYPTVYSQEVAFSDNVKYVVWLCKCREKMKFNKDRIREKHIWKDVEWGKRAKNYNPKGKDPGNVWIPTEDDGKANITKHIMLGDEGVINRLIAMTDCKNDYLLVNEPIKNSSADRSVSNPTPSESKSSFSDKVIFKTSEDMSFVPDGSVKLAVTSPPYWNLKDYFKEGQIGQEDYQTYLSRIKTVWEECFKKLRSDGSLWININIRVQNGKIIPIPHDIIKMCKEIGFFYKGIVIWHKSSGIPTGDKNIVDRHEYVLVFSKSESFVVKSSELRSFSDYKNDSINSGAFWNINRKAGSVGKKYIHPAIYPNELVSRIIKLTTDEGDLVSDPFLGSGTTMIAALLNNRSCIGYEYNSDFRPLMESRFSAEIPNAKILFIH